MEPTKTPTLEPKRLAFFWQGAWLENGWESSYPGDEHGMGVECYHCGDRLGRGAFCLWGKGVD